MTAGTASSVEGTSAAAIGAPGSKPPCGIVMKGGVTSGVVFPRAIVRLAETYRFRRIGGTSAGAIAAAAAAAAELGRTKGVDRFADLADLPRELGSTLEVAGEKTTRMLSLFQPEPATRPIFRAALAALREKTAGAKALSALTALGAFASPIAIAAIVVALLLVLSTAVALGPAALLGALAGALVLGRAAAFLSQRGSVETDPPPAGGLFSLVFLAAALAVAPALGAILSPGTAGPIWAGELAALLAAVVLAAGLGGSTLSRLRSGLRAIEENGFGMVTGGTADRDPERPGLTEWMHRRFQGYAGRPLDRPVTFADLSAAGIELRTMTTSLTEGRPHVLPFDTRVHYFHPGEFRKLFPAEVVDFLVARGESVIPELEARLAKAGPRTRPRLAASLARQRAMLPRLPLPTTELPIVVAARMSLSFPVLLSAVPLWVFDFGKPVNREANRRAEEAADGRVAGHVPERTWFSDGGLCSNFPVHLFDEPLPRWPTFAINLKYVERPPADRVQLIDRYDEGLAHDRVALDAPDGSAGSLFGFLGAIVETMQNWSDNVMLPSPGFRDRIAHLVLGKDEGGLHLDMDEETIGALGGYGHQAAHELAVRFGRPAKEGELSWDSHRWSRFRSTMLLLEETLDALLRGYEETPATGQTYAQLLARGKDGAPDSYAMSQRRGAHVVRIVEELRKLRAEWRAGYDPTLARGAPKPETEIHVRPRMGPRIR